MRGHVAVYPQAFNMKKSLIAAAILSAATLFAAPAMAEGLYITASAGVTKINVDGLDGFLAGTGVSVDDSSTGGKIGLGYKITPAFALEAGYASYGELTLSDGVDSVDIEASAIYFDVIGRAALGPKWGVFGKLGAVRAKAEALGESETSTEFKFGFGIDYMITKQLAVKTEFERINFDGGDANLYSIGLNYGF